MKKIELRYFECLRDHGSCVPRNNKTGETLTDFTVGREYTIGNPQNKETVKARVTQNCPVNLKLIP